MKQPVGASEGKQEDRKGGESQIQWVKGVLLAPGHPLPSPVGTVDEQHDPDAW